MYISASVGSNGVNKDNDVKFVQSILALVAEEDMRMPELVVDGKSGPNTVGAIKKFQRFYVKLKNPDGRVDPDGRSEKTLVAKALEIDKKYLSDLAQNFKLKKNSGSTYQSGPKVISYRINAKRVVSEYSENVIKLAMSYAGINRCDISSTIRTFYDQARIMHDNCQAFPGATSVDSLRSSRGWGYAAAGRQVEAVYYKNTSLGRDETIKAMENEIKRIYNQGQRVSLHCVSEGDYRLNNIIDIPYSSVVNSARREFEIALMGMAQETKNIRYKKPIAGETYITRLIVEDKCWHIEVPQLNKPLPNQDKGVVFTKPGPKGPVKSRKPEGSTSRSGFSFMSFLEYWF